MELQPITKVSKAYGVSTRTLRYYEQLGLISSTRLPDYAYRAYGEEALSRLRQILVLRIPLRQIGRILETRDARLAIETFEREIAGIQAERQALDVIEGVLRTLADALEKLLPAPLSPAVFEQARVVELVRTLSVQALSCKEETRMEDLSNASVAVERPEEMRILYLPPMTVASRRLAGDGKEEAVGREISAFIAAVRLPALKPDFRRFGFNNPAAGRPGGSLGYEAWVSVPPGLEVPPPLVRKEFLGGLYAARMIPFGEFHQWAGLWQWVAASQEYEADFAPRTDPPDPQADPALEEQLNAIHHRADSTPFGTQLDLLLPIRAKL